MNSTDQVPWAPYCSSTVLGFRAICNSVVDPGSRPVKVPVIRRITQSPDFAGLAKKHWYKTLDMPQAEAADAFWSSMAKDESWHTLVAETVAESRKWSELIKFDFHKLSEWLSSFLEKLWDKHHPAARAATATVATLGTLFVVHKVAEKPYDTITQPIRAIFMGDQPSIPISLVAADPNKPLSLPIAITAGQNGPSTLKIDVDAPKDAIPLHFVVDPKANDGLQGVINEIHSSNNTVQQAVRQLNELSARAGSSGLQQLSSELGQTADEMQENQKTLQAIRDNISELNQNYVKATNSQALTSREEADSIFQNLEIVALASVSHNPPIRLTIAEHSSESVVLPTFDPSSGTSSSASIKIAIGSVTHAKRDVSFPLTIVADEQSQKNMATIGKVIKLDSAPWKLTVSSVEKHTFSPDIINLTLAPEIAAVGKRKAPEGEQTASSRGN